MTKLEAAPLYIRVSELLIGRIRDGELAPGAGLPSEFELAGELGVSQGTVRKALGLLEARRIVERRQGRGTYVTETTPESALYHFFRLSRADGSRAVPEPVAERIRERPMTAREAAIFAPPTPGPVYEIARRRRIAGRLAARETMVVPASLMPDLPEAAPLPNALYAFYQERYGINVLRAAERLAAKPANGEDARALGVAAGTPLLVIERRAIDLGERVVELRQSRYLTDRLSYDIELS